MKTFKIAFFALLLMMTGAVNAASMTLDTHLDSGSLLDTLPLITGNLENRVLLRDSSSAVDWQVSTKIWRTFFTISDVQAESIDGFGANLFVGNPFYGSKTLVTTILGNGGSYVANLALGNYFVEFFGTPNVGGTTFNAQVQVGITETPLPAAVWLFGSALMGLFGVSRRKPTAVAA